MGNGRLKMRPLVIVEGRRKAAVTGTADHRKVGKSGVKTKTTTMLLLLLLLMIL